MKEPLLLTLCSASKELQVTSSGDGDDLKGKGDMKLEFGPNMKLDTELYEGVVSQPIIEPTVRMYSPPPLTFTT